jgi:hypothetical protein
MLVSVFDRVQHGLSALKGHYDRLRYLGRLCAKGPYTHWGLSRRYGQNAAEQGMLEAHRQVFNETLLTTLQQLDQEELARSMAEEPPSDRGPSLVPKGSTGGSRLHFRWLSECLEALRRARL